MAGFFFSLYIEGEKQFTAWGCKNAGRCGKVNAPARGWKRKAKMRTRTEGYVGQIIDGVKLAEVANKIYELQYDGASVCKVDNLLLVTLEETNAFGENKYAVVCSEGVGWEQDTYGCIEIPTNIGQGGYYNGRVFISVEIVKSCLSDKTEDIFTYIRTFGDRLDRNCDLWQSKMLKVEREAIA